MSEVIANNGGIAAHYEYAPFGALTAQSGESAAANPWRFSSEFADDELGCDYYNYREYEPMTGRLMNRDPVDIADCLPIYVFCLNHTSASEGTKYWYNKGYDMYDELIKRIDLCTCKEK